MKTNVLIVCFAAALAACGDVKPPGADAGDVDAPAVDGPEADAGDVDAPPGQWSAERVPNINSLVREGQPSATADHLELYFYREDYKDGADIMVSARASTLSPWGTPGIARDIPTSVYSPEVSPDGLELYFVSGQAVGRVTRPSRSSAWPTSATNDLWPVGTGGIALSGDALAAYYATPTMQVRRRRRPSSTFG